MEQSTQYLCYTEGAGGGVPKGTQWLKSGESLFKVFCLHGSAVSVGCWWVLGLSYSG
jgi:hypothetical protein